MIAEQRKTQETIAKHRKTKETIAKHKKMETIAKTQETIAKHRKQQQNIGNNNFRIYCFIFLISKVDVFKVSGRL